MAMAAAGANLPSPWEAVGRGTEVGRALFALYNGYGVARNRGNEYSDSNRMKIIERVSAQAFQDIPLVPPDPPKPKKPVVRVPRFQKKFNTMNIPKVLLMRGRRRGSQILTQMKEEMLQRDRPPAPKRPVLDEKEKARLQEIFEWSGRDVDEDEAESVVRTEPRKPPPARGSVEEQEMLMEAIANEIEERKIFLDKMFELGNGPKYEPIIRLEIQERIRQLELLDKTITSMDKERLQAEANLSARSSTQSRRAVSCDERSCVSSKPGSRQSPGSVSGGSEVRRFREQLDDVRRQNTAHKEMQGKGLQDEDEDEDDALSEVEEKDSISEKSFDDNLRPESPPCLAKSNGLEEARSLREPFPQSTLEATRPASLASFMRSHDVPSVTSARSRKCSSVQSGSIRSSLNSLKGPPSEVEG